MFVVPFARPSSLYRRDARLASFDGIVERLFDDVEGRWLGRSASPATRTPAMNVAENDTAYTVSFEVPGVAREQLKVSVEGRRVTLTTEAAAQPAIADDQAAPAADADRVLYRERAEIGYARTVSLPAEVDQAASQARFDNGVLTLVLAKKVPAGATQLRIA